MRRVEGRVGSDQITKRTDSTDTWGRARSGRSISFLNRSIFKKVDLPLKEKKDPQ